MPDFNKLIHAKYGVPQYSEYLSHEGILGMKWGVRRFQNPDGTLTEAGKKRYRSSNEDKEKSELVKALKRGSDEELKNTPQFKAAVEELRGAYQKSQDAEAQANKQEYDWYMNWYEKRPKGIIDIDKDDYPEDTKEYMKYARKYAEHLAKEYGDGSEKDVKNYLWCVVNDDLDGGETFKMYLEDHPKLKKQVDDDIAKAHNLREEYYDKLHKCATQYISDKTNKKVKIKINRGISSIKMKPVDAFASKVTSELLKEYYDETRGEAYKEPEHRW